MKYVIPCLTMILMLSQARGANDTTIFKNKFEQKIFTDYSDSLIIDPLELLSCYDYSESRLQQIKQRVHQKAEELDASGLRKKPLKKQIKIIYNQVHAGFFTKYEDKAFFNDIFTTGHFNCVTGTAMYAWYLQYFGIDFQIKETPNHVYIIADPDGTKTLMESTLPSNGVVTFDDKFKRNYVKFLDDNKVISHKEYLEKTTDELFNEFYARDKAITLIQLAALQYYNKGIFAYKDEKYSEAVVNFEKASILYPSVTIRFMLNSSYINELLDQNSRTAYSGKTLAGFMNINPKNAGSVSYSEDYFKVVANELVINHPKPEAFRDFYSEFKANISDSVDISGINQDFYYFQAYLYYVSLRYYEALQNLTMAYNENAENINIRELTQEVVGKYLLNETNYAGTIDSLEYYFDVFPFLEEDPANQRYYTYCFMRVISREFSRDNPKAGLAYIDRFNTMMQEHKMATIDQFVTNAYGDVSGYYLRKGKYATAEKYLNEGLHWAPDSYELRNNLDILRKVKGLTNNFTENIYNEAPKEINVNYSDNIDDFKKKFGKSWVEKSTTDLVKSETKDVSPGESMKIGVKGMKVVFRDHGVVQNGSWSLRLKSHLLYLIPEVNKEDFLVFKVVSITDTELKLRPYKDQKKLTNTILTFKVDNK